LNISARESGSIPCVIGASEFYFFTIE